MSPLKSPSERIFQLINCLFALCALFSAQCAESASISISLDPKEEGLSTEAEIPLIAEITHTKKESIDFGSFQVDGEPVRAEWLADDPLSTNELNSHYRILWKTKTAGYGALLLPEVSVKVQGIAIRSPRTIDQRAAQRQRDLIPSQLSTPSDEESEPAVKLTLQAAVEPDSPLYPGQTLHLFYLFSYRGNIDLIRETLPLLSPGNSHLTQVGTPTTQEFQRGSTTLLRVEQLAKAQAPGRYAFERSEIIGHSYQVNGNGEKLYDKEPLIASTNPLLIDILPFPSQGQPEGFTGTLGLYTMSAKLESPPTVAVGDPLRVSLIWSGRGELDTITTPNFSCQKGLRGLFSSAVDEPPTSQEGASSLSAIIEITPLTSLVQQLPPLAFSSFSPEEKRFLSSQTSSIALTVTAQELPNLTMLWPSLEMSPSLASPAETALSKAKTSNSIALPPATGPLDNPWLLFSAMAFLLLIQWHWKGTLEASSSIEWLIHQWKVTPQGNRRWFRLALDILTHLQPTSQLRQQIEQGLYSEDHLLPDPSVIATAILQTKKLCIVLSVALIAAGELLTADQHQEANSLIEWEKELVAELQRSESNQERAALYKSFGEATWEHFYENNGPTSSTTKERSGTTPAIHFSFQSATKVGALFTLTIACWFSSLALLYPNPILWRGAQSCIAIAFTAIWLFFLSDKLSPEKAMLLKPSWLYQTPKKEESSPLPILHKGSIVQLLKPEENGTWAQVQLANGQKGYLETSSLGLLP